MPKALVLGGETGMLGQALMRALAARGWEAHALGRQNGDLLDPVFIDRKLEETASDVVFNAIAWTQVDDAEDHPDEAMMLNRALPACLARAIRLRPSMRLVHYSTDFVFSGNPGRAWLETDEPRPQCVYGETKLAGERAVLGELPDRACVLRTAWLFGPGRRNFVDTILGACQKKDVLTVVDDQTGSPTYAPDLAQWSVDLAEKGASGLWHGVNSGRASWCELAAEAVQLLSGPCRVTPINSDQWPQKARRPAWSILDNGKLASFLGKKPRPWLMALREYLFGEYQARQQEARP